MSLYSVRREDISFLRGETTLPFLAWEDDFSNKETAQYLSNHLVLLFVKKDLPFAKEMQYL